MTTYVKISFVLTEGQPPVTWWTEATSNNLATAYYIEADRERRA